MMKTFLCLNRFVNRCISVDRTICHDFLKWALASLAAGYVLTVVGLAAFQRRLQYFPDRRLTELAQTGMSGGEELRLTTADGETLVAWHFPAKVGRPLILYFHGNAGALVDRVPRFRMFTASGYGVLAVSYRGYGGSTGSPTQSGLMQDGEAVYREARAWLWRRSHRPDGRIARDRRRDRPRSDA